MDFAPLKRAATTGTPFLMLVAAWAFSLSGCAGSRPAPEAKPGYPKPYKVLGKWYQPLPHSIGFRQSGVASWYGEDFHGKKTSSGEIYNMHAMTAAHKTLPLGTYVRVHNLENNRTVDVRVNDRGPFVHDRIIDLSYAAAKGIGIVDSGTARVEIVALGTPSAADDGSGPVYVAEDYYSGNFTFQVGAFVIRENAERQLRALEEKYRNAHISVYDRGDKIFYRVRVGKFTSLNEAVAQEQILIQDGFPDAFVVAD